MRPGQHQQNRRGRGRNNNGGSGHGGSSSGGSGGGNHQRKGQNPLTRSFESNGPDVKVRGTPAHIAEKYLALARDAQSAGDRVLAENYLQHAEHYNRIIMAYREQFQTPGDQQNQTPRRMPGSEGFEMGEDGDDDGMDGNQDDFGGGPQPGMVQPAQNAAPQPAGEGGNAPQHRPPQHGNQPRNDQRPEGRYDRPQGQSDRYGDNQQRGDRPFRRDGQQPNRFRDRNDRNFRPNENGNGQGDRNGNRTYEPRFDRGDRPRADQQNRPDHQRSEQHRPDAQRPDPQRQEFRPERGPRPERAERPERQDRFERQDRGQDRPDVVERVMPPVDAPRPVPAEPVGFVPQPLPVPPPKASEPPVAPTAAPAPRRRERLADQPSEQPEFLRRPVRRTKAAIAAAANEAPSEPAKVVIPAGPSSEDPSSTN